MAFLSLARWAVAVGLALAAGPVRASCPDLALVLAIDASGSVDKGEYALQVQGYAAALASPEVQAAVQAAGRVSVAVVLWGDASRPVQILPWRALSSQIAAVEMGESLLSAPRRVTGNTGIGRGLAEAIDLIETHHTCAARKVIDVSGDGRESFSPHAVQRIPLAPMRERASALGITVNGLAILNESADIAVYYRRALMTGPGAFVMETAGYHSFGEAILKKLVREIAPPQLAALE